MKRNNTVIVGNDSSGNKPLVHKPVEMTLLPQAVMVEPFLASHQVDVLAEAECDWISLLHPAWEIDLSSCCLLDVADESLRNSPYVSIPNLVPLTLQIPYRSITVYGQTYWTYTFCSQVVGLGRVRLVVSFDNPQLIGEYMVFVTNRLDWSPRRILETAQLLYQGLPIIDQHCH